MYISYVCKFKVPAFILKTSAVLLMSIPLATVIFKRSGTHRNGNLKKGDGEAVKSGTEGMITF